MFKWLRTRREATRRVVEDANLIVVSTTGGEPPSDPNPIAKLVRIVGESHIDDPRPRGDAGAHRTGARRKRLHRRALEAKPDQCRQARGVQKWTRGELGEAAGWRFGLSPPSRDGGEIALTLDITRRPWRRRLVG